MLEHLGDSRVERGLHVVGEEVLGPHLTDLVAGIAGYALEIAVPSAEAAVLVVEIENPWHALENLRGEHPFPVGRLRRLDALLVTRQVVETEADLERGLVQDGDFLALEEAGFAGNHRQRRDGVTVHADGEAAAAPKPRPAPAARHGSSGSASLSRSFET